MTIIEPPWRLTGTALAIGFPVTKRGTAALGRLSPQSRGTALGGPGFVVMADYRTSGVGPYRELLMAPGRFRFGSDAGHTITRIFVDSEESARSGRANWGIPKETAALSADFAADGSWRFSAALPADKREASFFSLAARPFGPAFPVPLGAFPFRLLQEDGGIRFATRPYGSAIGRLARLENIRSDPAVFPFPGRRPRLAVLLETFSLTFPPAELLDP